MVQKIGVKPKIIIKKNDGSDFTFNPHTSTFNFRLLRGSQFRPPVDSTGGRFSIRIAGSGSDLDAIASSFANIYTNIKEGNEVTFAAGKTSSTTDLMRGVIEDMEIDMQRKYTRMTLTGRDWGSDLLKHTVINGSWIQRKQANGVDLDMTDTTTTLKNIISDMISVTGKYPIRSDGITLAAKGLVYDATKVNPPDIKIPQFYANMEYADDKLSEIDEIAGSFHYVDFNKNLIVKSPTLESSGILLTDDTADTIALGWDQTKLGYIEALTYTRSLETHRKRMFGLGGDERLENDLQRQLTVTANDKIDTLWRAIKFQPYYGNVESVAVYVDKVGTPADLDLMFCENDTGVANGQPIISKPIVSKSMEKEKISGTAEWKYFQVNQDVDIGKFYWVVLQRTNNASHYYRWYRTSGSTAYTIATSSDGTSWTRTPNTDGYAFRAVSTNPLLLHYPVVGVTASDKHFHEEVIRRPDITQRETMSYLIQGLMNQIHAKKKLIIKANVYVPDAILQIGKTVRIRVQKGGVAIDDNFVIGDLEYRFDSHLGYLYQTIVAARYTAYS